jgi:signal transduction histidine kinase
MITVNDSAVGREGPAEIRGARVGPPTPIALIDSRGLIVAVNQDWTALAEETGAVLPRVRPGMNYLDVFRRASSSTAASRKALFGIQEVLRGKILSFSMDHSLETEIGPRSIRMAVTPVVHGNVRLAITLTDISDLKPSNAKSSAELQQFARRLIRAQEEERQKIAREIHDALGNRIAMLSLSLRQSAKQECAGTGTTAQELDTVLDGITNLSTALRNLSHWLHPPALRYLGVVPALKSLQQDFAKAYSMRVDLVAPKEVPRLSDEIELCIYRISQECLQNIAKHSGSDQARIVLEYSPKQVRLTVSDSGRGFDRVKAVREGGLGLLSMEQRAQSNGGRLTINATPGLGTEIRLVLRLSKATAATAQ